MSKIKVDVYRGIKIYLTPTTKEVNGKTVGTGDFHYTLGDGVRISCNDPFYTPQSAKDKIDYPALTNVFDSEKLGTVISNLVNKKIDERIGDVEDLLYKLLGNMKAKEVEDIVKKELDQVDEIIENGSKVNSK